MVETRVAVDTSNNGTTPEVIRIPNRIYHRGEWWHVTDPVEPKEGGTEPHRMIISVDPANEYGANYRAIKPESWIKAQVQAVANTQK